MKYKQTHLQEKHEKATFGFWLYLMTDCLLFASLFATFAVLRNNTNGGSDAAELFSLKFVLTETILLLLSSFTAGLSLIYAKQKQSLRALLYLSITTLLGVAFVSMELKEFYQLIAEGNDWQRSAFLSAFCTLVGTHGLHICIGLLWAFTLIWRLIRRPIDDTVIRRLSLFTLFWHFLDLIWIFIFSFVYIIGVAA